jgi:hypothetical protein
LDDFLYFKFCIDGWIKDLTVDGVESNPGPTWGEIEKQLQLLFGSEYTENHEKALKEINAKIRSHCEIGEFDASTQDHVDKYFADTNDNHPLRRYIEDAIKRLTALPPTIGRILL